MSYYRKLNLEREPFSNSPDPGLFFNSEQHLEILQKLEISIRLKRGLSVVTGDVGTGKTTISRQLIQRISSDPKLTYGLMLDPGVTTVTDFLGCVLTLLTGGNRQAGEDESSLKERIKSYLFKQGVEKRMITVLIIDEGQKLSLVCLEVLRELLNYETNDQKLLQIVIFAQKEFQNKVAALPNFKDRINFRYALGNLGYRETREMIRYRLVKSSAPGHKGDFFSALACFAVYLFTRGGPRRIVNLCHHVILTLIVRNRSKAGLFLVGACGFKVLSGKGMGGFLKSGGVLLLLACAGVWGVHGLDFPGRPFSPAEIPETDTSVVAVRVVDPGIVFEMPILPASEPPASEPPVSEPPASEPSVSESSVSEPSASEPLLAGREAVLKPSPLPMPSIYGTLRVPKDYTLYSMMVSVYGVGRPRMIMDAVLKANPDIKDPGRIMAGQAVDFPVLDPAKFGWNKDSVCIVLSREDTFGNACKTSRKYQRSDVAARVLPVWTQSKGFLFLVVFNRPFKTMASARAFMKDLPTGLAGFCTRLDHAGAGNMTP